MKKTNSVVSLGELSIELGINKSKLNYYFSKGLLSPVSTVSRMNLFNKEDAVRRMGKIEDLQSKGKTLEEIQGLLK